MLRWWVLAWVVLVSCKSEKHYTLCGQGPADEPGEFGDQPGFERVANAPRGIEEIRVDRGGKPVVRTTAGLYRYDGEGAWTMGPSIPTLRTFYGSEREIYAVSTTGAVYLLVESSFEWMPVANPLIDDVIGHDFVGRFHGVDRATHSLWTWMTGETAWTKVDGSELPAAPVEAIVTHGGIVYRTIGDGKLYRTNGTTAALTSTDGSTLVDEPMHLVTDRSNNLYFGCRFSVLGTKPGWEAPQRPSFAPYTSCSSLQWMPDNMLTTFRSDPDEPSVNNTAMHDMATTSGGTTIIIKYLDGNYEYVARDRDTTWGFRSDDVEPHFIESTF